MEVARFSETLITYCTTTWHHNPEDLNLNLHHYENLESSILSRGRNFSLCHHV
jgi:hypothetical protein